MCLQTALRGQSCSLNLVKLLSSDDALFVLTVMQHEHSKDRSFVWRLQCQENNINYIVVYTKEAFLKLHYLSKIEDR